LETRGRTRTAQGEIKRPRAFQPLGTSLAFHHQRVLQQREQGHRREALRRRRGERDQQRPRRRLGERPPRAVVRFDVPTLQVSGNAAGEIAVGRDERGGPLRHLQRLPQSHGDRLRLLGRIGELERAHTGESPLRRLQLLPFGGEESGGHGIGDGAAPHRRCVPAAAPAPPFDFAAPDAHPLQQELQMVLRMRLHRGTAAAGDWIGLMRPQRLPFALRHLRVEARQHHHSPRQPRHRAEQSRHGRRRRGDARGGDETWGRLHGPAFCHRREQPVAALGQVDAAAVLEQGRPVVEDHRQPVQRLLPVQRKVRQVRGELAQPARLHLLDQQLIEGAGEIGREAERLGRVDPARHVLLDQPGEQHQPLDRLDRRRNPLPLPQRLQGAADPLVQLRVADRHEPRQQESALGAPHEGIRDRPRRAVVRHQDQATGEPCLVVAVARDQARRERIGKGPVRRDGVDGGTGDAHPPRLPARPERSREAYIMSPCRRPSTSPGASQVS
jgi:hypothetical protein